MAAVAAYVLGDAECESFRRCRRQWDFSSPERQNWEPLALPTTVDARRALREALVVYYFPGMWEWPRAMVEKLALEAFARSISAQQADAQLSQAGDLVEAELRVAEEKLQEYFRWAPRVDRFAPIRVQSDFLVNLPDPSLPGQDLVASDGRPVRYSGRIELLVQDADERYWLVHHRLGATAWAESEDLRLDQRGANHCWAWEDFFLGMKISGSVYNEVRWPSRGDTGQGQPRQNPGDTLFRRVRISRSPQEFERWRKYMALLAVEMIDPELPVYPAPAEHCSACDYRAPCLGMFQRPEGDGPLMMGTSFRQRAREGLEERRLGAVTWSFGRGAAPR